MPVARADRPAHTVKGSGRAMHNAHVIDLGTGVLPTGSLITGA